jgi:hypothetical protein
MNFNPNASRAVSVLMKSLIAKVVTPVVEGVVKAKKSYPKMITTPEIEIGVHNQEVKTRQVKRSKARLDKKLGK